MIDTGAAERRYGCPHRAGAVETEPRHRIRRREREEREKEKSNWQSSGNVRTVVDSTYLILQVALIGFSGVGATSTRTAPEQYAGLPACRDKLTATLVLPRTRDRFIVVMVPNSAIELGRGCDSGMIIEPPSLEARHHQRDGQPRGGGGPTV